MFSGGHKDKHLQKDEYQEEKVMKEHLVKCEKSHKLKILFKRRSLSLVG